MMNERIRELAEQARKHFPKTESSGEFWVFDEAKFAELIVRECTQIVADAVDHREPASSYAGKIQEHFGVK
jgi:hypothetical protein